MSSDPLILCVVGARPNFMKIAPLIRAIRQDGSGLRALLLHTGQHYDDAMNRQFFEQLEIPEAEVNLNVGSGSHAVQTAEIMLRFEPLLQEHQPAAVLVVGDVNSTIACALVAAKLGTPVVHVEAGLRSRDRSMPEEINRVLTDQLSDLLFTTEDGALDNLVAEGIAAHRVHWVGNVMIDTLLHSVQRAVPAEETLSGLGQGALRDDRPLSVVTLHRPANVDDGDVLRGLVGEIRYLAQQTQVVFPVHPRTRQRLEAFGLDRELDAAGVVCTGPLGYLQMLGLLSAATVVLTDSGGLQEETTALGVPCLTLRENTERPVTVSAGTNTIVGRDSAKIRSALAETLATGGKRGRIPELWDGHAAERIAAILARHFRAEA